MSEKNGKTTWRKEILAAMSLREYEWENEGTGETWDDIISCTLTDAELDTEFDSSFGHTNGIPFTVWTKDYVYFPHEYDGAEDVAFVARNPNGKATNHI